MMTRRGRENLFVAVSLAALGAWWLAKKRAPGSHKVGQGLAEYFRRGLGGPPIRIEVAPWRRQYYPTFPSSYIPTPPNWDYGSTYQPPVAYRSAPPVTYSPAPPPVTYRPAPMPGQPVRPSGVQVLPPPAPPRAASSQAGRPSFADRWRVEQAQRWLNTIYGNLLEESGRTSPKMSEVLRLFQQQHDLPPTGALDDGTNVLLEGIASQQHQAPPAPPVTAEDWPWERPGQTS